MITEIRNGHNVKRYHTQERIREETVGHHSAGVCGIILRLDRNCSRDLLVAALMHDVQECVTGDIPAPFKREHPAVAPIIRTAENEYDKEHDIPFPHKDLSDKELKLLHLADTLDLVLSSIEEVGRGNNYAKKCIVNGERYIRELNIPKAMMLDVEAMVYEVKQQWELMLNK